MTEYLLNEDTITIVSKIIKKADFLFLFLDYDGTLAPFRDDPERAGPLPGIINQLQVLSRDENIYVTIISGRERNSLKRQLHLEDVELSGLHGLQSPSIDTPLEKYSKNEIENIKSKIKQTISANNLTLEDKKFGLTIHLSPSVDRDIILKKIKNMTNNNKYQVIPGRQNIEIKPALWNKGLAVSKYVKYYHKLAESENYITIYVGDDRTDEDVFRRCRNGITIYVVNEGNKNTSARYYLDNPTEVRTFLNLLLKLKVESV
ncbi:MAG: trehalose-phosphatase [Halanaerobiaceae bacterium]